MLLGALACALLSVSACCAAETIRVAAQKTGTFAWELAVIRAHGLDKQQDLTIETAELASPEAGKIALRAGSADIMVSDWLWVSRERALGAKLAFYPYSSALGAVMVPATSPIHDARRSQGQEARGRRRPYRQELAAAAGCAEARGYRPEIAGRRSSMARRRCSLPRWLDGEMDASLNYWNFCAALEAKGFRRLAGIEEILPKFGAKGTRRDGRLRVRRDWADAHRDLLARFLAMTAKAKEILATSDAEWKTIAPLTGATDAATLQVYRDRYREGIPHRPIADEEADARILYGVLAKVGGRELVGPAPELSPGTYYNPAPRD